MWYSAVKASVVDVVENVMAILAHFTATIYPEAGIMLYKSPVGKIKGVAAVNPTFLIGPSTKADMEPVVEQIPPSSIVNKAEDVINRPCVSVNVPVVDVAWLNVTPEVSMDELFAIVNTEGEINDGGNPFPVTCAAAPLNV